MSRSGRVERDHQRECKVSEIAMRTVSVGATVMFVIAVAACTGPAEKPAQAEAVRVSVSMYSGREDPVFTLSKVAADALRACLEGPSAKVRPTPFPDGLGFRYFVVTGATESATLVGIDGAWVGSVKDATPVPICDEGFSILRRAAAASLPQSDLDGIPER